MKFYSNKNSKFYLLCDSNLLKQKICLFAGRFFVLHIMICNYRGSRIGA